MQFHLKIPRSGGSKKEEKVNRQSSLWKICRDEGIFYRGDFKQLMAEAYSQPNQISKWRFLWKDFYYYQRLTINYVPKNIPLKYLTGFWI